MVAPVVAQHEATGPVSIVRVHDAVVQFDGPGVSGPVFGPISFDVTPGECVVLLGPSGCGKSTLLAALAGLQKLTSGTAQIGDGATQPGFVFQDANLMTWASARDNVALPLSLAGVTRPEQVARAQAALDQVGLGRFSAMRPRALSGGMAMRVALARALVSQPKALLLDEPFAAIDELGRRGLNDLVHHIKDTARIGLVFVTHSVEEAVYMADRILVMSARPGRITHEIHVEQLMRDASFLMSDVFSKAVSETRRALAEVSG